MTTVTMALTELAEKGADIDVLRQMVQFMAQRASWGSMSRGAAALATTRRAPSASIAATAFESAPRTRAGSVELKISKLRQGSYFPGQGRSPVGADRILTHPAD